jgi:4-hydroxy-tetrahydrodipicolinate synthase
MNADFAGLGVALATPLDRDDRIDLAAFRRLVRHVVEGGADVLIPLGTTGEAVTLSDAERDQVLTACLEEARGRPVVAGTGSNSTAQACAFTTRAQQLGAQGALVVTPYYNKPMPQGLLAHYAAVAAAAPGLPLVVYNVPGRTAVNLLPATLLKLWELPQVVAVKESSGNLLQIGEVARSLPRGKLLLAGDDALALASIAVGAQGLVSVLGNLLPRAMKQLVDAAREHRMQEARELHARLLPAMDAVMAESNPIPLKAGLQMLGIGTDRVRLPLSPAEPRTRERLGAVLREFGALP